LIGRLFIHKLHEGLLKREHGAGLTARRLAVGVLSVVLRDGRPVDEAFNRLGAQPEAQALAERDRAFARAIVMAALRRAGQIRDVLKHFIVKPLPKDRGEVDEILLAAAAQLLFLNTPPHAAINIAVHQVRENKQSARFKGLANAVLRRLSSEGPALVAAQDAEKLNTPDWLWASWATAYGEDVARRIALQHLREPALDLTVKSDPQGWARKLGGITLRTGSVRLRDKGRIEALEGYGEGEWWVQDAAAALPARLLGDVRGLRVADLCSAPGGKTAELAQAGGLVWALDSSPQRLERLRENLARLKLSATVVVADAASWTDPEGGLFDAVILDAPCTATGAIRRHPDIAHAKRPEDVTELAGLQARLLDHAADLLKPGGKLVFCTCSIEPREGPEHIMGFLRRRPEMRLDPISPDDVGGYGEWLARGGWLRTLPCYLQLSDPELSGMDGFFAARFRKADAA
jgi:16S rRNA (cytosine967-C5)-methyltransferase